MQVISHDTIDELKQLRRKAKGGLRDRLQIVILAMQEQFAPEIARAVGAGRRNVQDWVYRYNASGLDGLVDHRGGNHRHLSDEQELRIYELLQRTASDPHDGVRRGEDLRRWVHVQFGVLYTLTGIYDMLNRLGYSCLMPRPRHANSDPTAQTLFKTKSAAKWLKSPRPIRASASKSGSRMKRGSANKGR
jgi:transposase